MEAIKIAIGLFAMGILLVCIAMANLMVTRNASVQCKENVKTSRTLKLTEDINLNVLDYQFSKENNPIVIYRDMFTRSAPWIGGYDIAIGKTIITRKESK